MGRFLTFSRTNQILVEITKLGGYHGNDSKILEIEIQELIDLGFIRLGDNDLILGDKTICGVTKEGEKFLNVYLGYRKIEYFFKDYPSLLSLLIGFIGGMGALLVKSIISGGCDF